MSSEERRDTSRQLPVHSDAPRRDGFAIRVRDVSKHYLMYDRPEDRLKQMVMPRLDQLSGRPPRRYFRDFAALNGVSFDVRRGETVGIIGRNGSGKSTMLQIICGTLQPTGGSVEVDGRAMWTHSLSRRPLSSAANTMENGTDQPTKPM